MFSWITGAISIFKALIDLWRYWQEFQESQRVIAAAKKEADRIRAIDAAMKATTPEEAWNAQDDIVNSEP